MSSSSSQVPSLSGGRIPALDGLRAISILFVIIGHAAGGLEGTMPRWLAALLPFIGSGDFGVGVFFVISGFLITWLLTQEIARTGRVDLTGFYVRRAYRIWPAYFALVITVAILAWRGVVAVTGHDIAAASLFVWNYVRSTGDAWWLGHTWSLSVEEQFYLLWPACMLLWRVRGCQRLALAIVVLSPAIRVATYFLFPERRAYIGMMLHTRADMLMFGCLLALILAEPPGQALVRRLLAWRLHLPAIGFILLVSPVLRQHYAGAYLLPLGFTLEGLSIALVLAWVTLEPGTRAARLLDTPVLRHIGVLSFSLYLWQQVFTHEVPGVPGVPMVVRLLLMVAAAELSYHAIEQPFLRLRRRRTRNPAGVGVAPDRRAA